jgi:hypothetical protein
MAWTCFGKETSSLMRMDIHIYQPGWFLGEEEIGSLMGAAMIRIAKQNTRRKVQSIAIGV